LSAAVPVPVPVPVYLEHAEPICRQDK
jgi:hypothetical protein